ncbi:flagellar basal body-associated FliL family protein [Zhongshania sp.]|jgi:flagellar FliL protein|uniref:flagellar basal body-associated FliL family protein n=1 Tax=Zhongshania sp. TaxID=1971902 RepID=UPI002A810231|nr:flagellar basal body-associated FliL family protein [Zhongshania sp.]
MKSKIILIVGVLVLLLAAVGGTWWFMKSTAPPMPAADGEAAVAAVSALKAPEYYSLSPSFVVNLQNERSMRFLMIEIELMSRRDDTFSRVEQYEPRIRNDLLLFLSKLDREAIATVEQRQKIQEEAMAVINDVLKTESGKGGIDAVYFTKFVVQ